MIKIEDARVFNWDGAIRGMRNPMNSWDKSDSGWQEVIFDSEADLPDFPVYEYVIGPNDLKLAKSLVKAGSDDRKFLRQIFVSVDITAPLYWWKECDTYKVGTTSNSCSTMHKIHAKEFTLDDFSHEHLFDFSGDDDCMDSMDVLYEVVKILNLYRERFLDCTVSKYEAAKACEERKKEYWWQMIQLLPSSYNQRRTVTLNYEVLLNMYHARKDHKLDEWHVLCDWIIALPNFKKICLED